MSRHATRDEGVVEQPAPDVASGDTARDDELHLSGLREKPDASRSARDRNGNTADSSTSRSDGTTNSSDTDSDSIGDPQTLSQSQEKHLLHEDGGSSMTILQWKSPACSASQRSSLAKSKRSSGDERKDEVDLDLKIQRELDRLSALSAREDRILTQTYSVGAGWIADSGSNAASDAAEREALRDKIRMEERKRYDAARLEYRQHRLSRRKRRGGWSESTGLTVHKDVQQEARAETEAGAGAAGARAAGVGAAVTASATADSPQKDAGGCADGVLAVATSGSFLRDSSSAPDSASPSEFGGREAAGGDTCASSPGDVCIEVAVEATETGDAGSAAVPSSSSSDVGRRRALPPPPKQGGGGLRGGTTTGAGARSASRRDPWARPRDPKQRHRERAEWRRTLAMWGEGRADRSLAPDWVWDSTDPDASPSPSDGGSSTSDGQGCRSAPPKTFHRTGKKKSSPTSQTSSSPSEGEDPNTGSRSSRSTCWSTCWKIIAALVGLYVCSMPITYIVLEASPNKEGGTVTP